MNGSYMFASDKCLTYREEINNFLSESYCRLEQVTRAIKSSWALEQNDSD